MKYWRAPVYVNRLVVLTVPDGHGHAGVVVVVEVVPFALAPTEVVLLVAVAVVVVVVIVVDTPAMAAIAAVWAARTALALFASPGMQSVTITMPLPPSHVIPPGLQGGGMPCMVCTPPQPMPLT